MRRTFIAAWLLILCVAALAFFALQLWHPSARQVMLPLRRALSGIKPVSGIKLWGQIAWHNELAVLIVLALGLIPVPLLYWYNAVATAASIGMVIYVGAIAHQNIWLLIATGLLPHGIIELSCFAITLGIAGELNYYIRSRTHNMRNQKDDWVGQLPLRPFLYALFRQYLFIVLPGLIIAGFIEALITPKLMHLVGI
ncbi:hypothetical protein BSQ39_00485 [Loigolactobacillus backii]|uniref:Stage II sporulation protein M n=2 Tax=Lactobacillaceae TaxID=33958 RepID=A0A192H3U3_9LACO|nr:hypothetical protein AYR52_11485 [Loigolactobacillus backii]ANK63489.1 hypothetical protein AYR53_01830 [Loigolactobacillus backii]ANK65958.1 hypothetical protein AYR54_11280 [Loigolactobacillus backii]ANK68422.1 hypothetical protein AYR55_11430 [Loigolactobacillus backii]ANK70889.1 hypothetical protein AYR56_02880 [Loigolactobacillus backii]